MTHPLIAHVLDLDGARAVAADVEPARALADAFWPGPLTVVLRRVEGVPAALSGGLATVAVPILPGAVLGAIGAVTLDPGATRWMAPNNAVYNLAVQPGSVTAGGNLAIQNVTPGGGLLPPGTVVRVEGFGFRPDTAIDVPGVAIAATNYAGPAEIDFTLGGSTNA